MAQDLAQDRPGRSSDRDRREGAEPPTPTGIGERFPRESRLRRGDEFKRVFSRGARLLGPHLALHLLPSEHSSSRLGLAVPKAVGSAVVRNRVKRRLRDIFRRNLRARLDGGLGAHEVVIRALPGAGGLSRSQLETELVELLERSRRRPRRARPEPRRETEAP